MNEWRFLQSARLEVHQHVEESEMAVSMRVLHARFWLMAAALIACTVQAAHGQTPDANQRRASIALDYRFPTGQERFDRFLKDTIGPGAILQSGFIAGTHHFVNDPPEWGRGFDGYNRRLASQFGRTLIQNSFELGIGAALRQDLSYQRCNCSGFLHRTGHALFSSFTARTPDGRSTFTLAKVAGVYAGAMISTAWYPDRYTATGDGVRFGNVSAATGALTNIAREFWPEIRRFFRR